ncbi:uncharacterized protein N7482_005476 [Penicillium canariense]|uniref:F-box domain-containing protein n=1 Tax=Penicillium canariense TaxID=189055 RepID=A0A9W9I2G8_9EURO|nr:uncharacterized protein N7482_005476 [Penicillium canariense]KAJ5166695.1 hypothetical protein N7482_005476 [Penicillium canariense]
MELLRVQISPQEKVVSTAELLELILLQLDLRTLLTAAQRTCRSWNILIRDSPSLQKALYFVPNENVPKSWNPLLAEVFPSFFSEHGTAATNFGKFTFSTLDMIKYPDKIIAYNRKEASWRRMLVQQPPILELAFFDVILSRSVQYSQSIIRVSLQDLPCSALNAVTETTYGQPRANRYPHLHDGLRMEALFEFVVTRGPLRFVQQKFHRVFWTASPPDNQPTWRGNDELVEAFKKATAQLDLVVYQITTRGCIRRPPVVTEEEKLRRLIFSSYAELNQDAEPETYDEVDAEEKEAVAPKSYGSTLDPVR